ncbi:glycoside hydrolase family 61 protein [Hyaloscypha variabilis]|uniref:AA9 family lytic polysaccharide monooxygenase n=1 Tax=Hyaloscypha variabilis (strain UAMH 11265 / GT02V1 / F) TaxID=1149755 RepID=A0A2J6SB63_HYAVF|nr:glycoside hydrolase family 61 protein [Hyaloscypha variabilis F]
MKFDSILYAAATLSMASAHTIMNKFNNNAQGAGIYMPSDDSPQMDVTSKSIACNGSPVSGFKSSSQKLSVAAGSTVTGAWLHTLTSTGADSEADNKVIASSHKGPVLAYLKKVSDATQNPSAGPGDGWFKIAEQGLISSSQWAVDKLISDGGIQSVTIPPCIENGDYLLRFEIIALHNARSYPGAQFYMECAQITVTGGTGSKTPSTVSIPGTYSGSDPGIKVNIYNSKGQPYPSSYQIPGPAVFTC